MGDARFERQECSHPDHVVKKLPSFLFGRASLFVKFQKARAPIDRTQVRVRTSPIPCIAPIVRCPRIFYAGDRLGAQILRPDCRARSSNTPRDESDRLVMRS